MNIMGTVIVVLLLAMVALEAYFLAYMDRLKAEGCQCAMGWHRTFIEACLVFFILHTLLVIGMLLTGFRHPVLMAVLNMVSVLLTVAYVVVARQFLNEVAKSHCQCAQGTAYTVLNTVNIALIVVLVLQVVSAIVHVAVDAYHHQRTGTQAQPAKRR